MGIKPFWTDSSTLYTYEIEILPPGKIATQICSKDRWERNKRIATGMSQYGIKSFQVGSVIIDDGWIVLEFSELVTPAVINDDVKCFLKTIFVDCSYEDTKPSDWIISEIDPFEDCPESLQIIFCRK